MDWHHSPLHRFGQETTFFITGATYRKEELFREPAALNLLRDILMSNAKEHACWLQAWALLSNHYHLVVRAEVGENVRRMISRFHTESAIALNRLDKAPGRKVWFQYWDKTLTFESSWLARLRYTHENAVHHRVVRVATEYPWCSAREFALTAPRSFVATVRRVKIDRVRVYDDFFTRAAAVPPHS